jgi:hypothetical protein
MLGSVWSIGHCSSHCEQQVCNGDGLNNIYVKNHGYEDQSPRHEDQSPRHTWAVLHANRIEMMGRWHG